MTKTREITEIQLQRRAKMHLAAVVTMLIGVLIGITILNVPVILICASSALINFGQLRRNVALMAYFHPEWQ